MSRAERAEEIKAIIQKYFENKKNSVEEILLFGSRARGDFDRYSDYDILIVVKNPVEISEKIVISEEIRDKLSKIHIPIDIIIKSKDEVSYYKDKIGSVVREALKEGIHL